MGWASGWTERSRIGCETQDCSAPRSRAAPTSPPPPRSQPNKVSPFCPSICAERPGSTKTEQNRKHKAQHTQRKQPHVSVEINYSERRTDGGSGDGLRLCRLWLTESAAVARWARLPIRHRCSAAQQWTHALPLEGVRGGRAKSWKIAHAKLTLDNGEGEALE